MQKVFRQEGTPDPYYYWNEKYFKISVLYFPPESTHETATKKVKCKVPELFIIKVFISREANEFQLYRQGAGRKKSLYFQV